MTHITTHTPQKFSRRRQNAGQILGKRMSVQTVTEHCAGVCKKKCNRKK